MFELREPKFEWGQRVATLTEIFNDGSYPDVTDDALLVPAGAAGEIVQVGYHEAANLPVYMVEFGDFRLGERPCVVGVFEEEIALL